MPARIEEHECRVCKARFDAKRIDARYCSPRCRQAISRFMRKEGNGGKSKIQK